MKDKEVLFAGYKMPHPLEHKFVLRVQTRTADPKELVLKLIEKLEGDTRKLESAYDVYFSFFFFFLFIYLMTVNFDSKKKKKKKK